MGWDIPDAEDDADDADDEEDEEDGEEDDGEAPLLGLATFNETGVWATGMTFTVAPGGAEECPTGEAAGVENGPLEDDEDELLDEDEEKGPPDDDD